MDPSVYRQMALVEQTHWWFAARRAILASLIRSLPLPVEPRILEIGCGTGGNLNMLSQFGTVCAVEADEFALAHARTVSSARIAKGWLPDGIPFQRDTFDVVCLFDVLEHVEDDRSALAAAATCVRNGGIAIVTVPAYQWMYGPHDRAHHHFRRYTARAVRQLADAAELSVRRVGYFNSLLFPLIAGVRLAKRIGGLDNADEVATPPPGINALLHRIFALEAAIVPHALFPFGTSCAAVLERH